MRQILSGIEKAATISQVARPNMNSHKTSTWILPAAIFSTFAALAWFVLSHAWMTDDAYFSFRTIDNFVNGYGLVWNTIERVQVYSHPLWVLILSVFYFFTREAFVTSIFVSLVCTLIAAYLVYKISANPWHGLASLWLLALSTAFVDYSTSGLENPLSHLLLALFLFMLLRIPERGKKLFWLSLIASFATVNRHDTILFYLPVLALVWWEGRDKLAGFLSIAIGFLPLVLWEIFSLFYYGLPFPNTFYAKTQNFVPLVAEIWNGLMYFFFTLRYDPLTWVVILCAIGIAFVSKSKTAIAVISGLMLYMAYILRIGGDFMGHRFLSTVFVGSVIVLAFFGFERLKPRQIWLVPLAAFLFSLLAVSPTYRLYPTNFQRTLFKNAGNEIVDERMIFYYANLFRIDEKYEFDSDPSHHFINDFVFFAKSIFRGTIFRIEPDHNWVALGRYLREEAETHGWYVTLEGASGIPAYYAGPKVHIVQALALTDVFLSHIPPRYNPNWRSAHFQRIVPEGYLDVLGGATSHLGDSQLDPLLQRVLLVTQGPLLTIDRAEAIWQLNTTNIFDQIPRLQTTYRFPSAVHIQSNGIGVTEPDQPIKFFDQGGTVQIEFETPLQGQRIRFQMDAGDNFEVVYLDKEDQPIASTIVLSTQIQGKEVFTIEIPRQINDQIFAVRIQSVRYFFYPADGMYTFHSFEVINN